jgi:hypothetical protein
MATSCSYGELSMFGLSDGIGCDEMVWVYTWGEAERGRASWDVWLWEKLWRILLGGKISGHLGDTRAWLKENGKRLGVDRADERLSVWYGVGFTLQDSQIGCIGTSSRYAKLVWITKNYVYTTTFYLYRVSQKTKSTCRDTNIIPIVIDNQILSEDRLRHCCRRRLAK